MTDITEQQITLTDLSLAELRRELVAANHEHRAAEDELKTARAKAEADAITIEAGTYAALKNEGERARFLTVYLSDNAEYQECVEAESDARSEVEAIRAEIAIREDAINERRASQRDREMDLISQKLDQEREQYEHHKESESEIQASLQKMRDLIGGEDDEPVSARVGRA